MTELIACPLCRVLGERKEGESPQGSPAPEGVILEGEATGRRPLFEAQDHLPPPGRFRFVHCPRCGLVYVNPHPTWEERQTHYNLSYRGYHRLETEASRVQQRSMRYGLEKRSRVVNRWMASGRLLDVGCGGGDFAAVMSQKPDWQVSGMERIAAIAGSAREHYPELSVLVGDLLEAPFAPGSLDAITLWTVLEHLADPVVGLRTCAGLLRPGGLLVVRTVCLESWARRLFGPDWIGYDAPRILTIFSRDTLRRILEACGFEICSLGEPFHDFHPYLWCLHNRYAGNPRLLTMAGSWPARLISLPYFVLQTALGGNSFVTAVARRTG